MSRIIIKGTREELFGSGVRVRALRFFIRNPHQIFALGDIQKRLKIKRLSLRKELTKLAHLGFLKQGTVRVGRKRKVRGWSLDSEFEFLRELTPLILKSSADFYIRLEKDLKRLGTVKLAIIGGMFTSNTSAKADLLVVMTKISKKKVSTFIQNLEAEMGQELRCVVMDLKEFDYRIKLYDRFVRDMLDRKNRRLINKMGKV